MTYNFEEICKKTIDIAKKTGKFIREERNKLKNSQVEVKGIHNFVTYVDKTAEQQIVDGLISLIPEAGFIVEEETITKTGEKYNWIIDPLDGTTNYIHGLSPFAVSIGLQENDKIILGVIYEISLDECFYAWKGSKAYLNGKEISVTQTDKVKDSLIATGFPYYDYHLLDKFVISIRYFMENSHGLRRIGSAATDLAYVACGRFEAFYEYSLNPWDVAAGAFLVERAGGKVSDFEGGNNYLFGKEIIATNSDVYDEFFEIVNKIIYKN
jgi:myo-inositol-1(or 4)-monophosphatase